MKLLERIWPWSRFTDYEWRLKERSDRLAELKQQVESHRQEVEFHRQQTEFHRQEHSAALVKLQDEKDKHEVSKNGLRHIATTLAMRGGFDKIALVVVVLFLCFSGFAQPVLPTILTTNSVTPAGSDGWLLISVGNKPVWTATITAQVENWWDSVTNIDTNVWPIGVLTWGYDGHRWTGGDGATLGGIPFGIRYVNDLTNFYIGGRTGEVAVTTGQNIAGLPGSVTGTALWMNTGGGPTNFVQLINVTGQVGQRAFISQSPIEVSYGSYGSGSDKSTYGLPGVMDGFQFFAGNGGSSITGGHGGNGGALRAIAFNGGSAGSGTGVNSVGGNGGLSGVMNFNGGGGGNDTQAAPGGSAGNGGNGGTITLNGGAGADDGSSFNGGTGGNAGTLTMNGGGAPPADNTSGANGGAGGNVTTSGTSTRPGGSITTFASSYAPATLFTTTTSAGLVSSTTGSLIGTAQFLAAPSGQAQGAFIGSNIVDHIGRTLRITAWGYLATNGTPTLQIQVKLGSTAVVDTGAQTISSITATQAWKFTADIPFRTTGASGTVLGQGKLEYGTSSASTQAVIWALQTATSTINTITDEAIGLTATMSTGSGNVFICTGVTADLVN